MINTASIIFPARSRIECTENLLLSVEKFTKNKSKIDVVGICDHDDFETLSLFQRTALKVSYEFKFISRPHSNFLDLPNDYYSLGLDLSEASYFKWILGNDCSINTQDWDLELDKIINTQEFQSDFRSNKYYYISISDDTHWKGSHQLRNGEGAESCCFPIVSSNYCLDLEEFYPREYPTWGGDKQLWRLANSSRKFKILSYQDKIAVLHKSFHNKTMEFDSVAQKVSMNDVPLHVRRPMPEGVENLLKEITEKRIKFLEIPNPIV